MIKSFADKETEKLHDDRRVRKFHAIQKQARKKLSMLDAATGLQDLEVPPGNKLELLSGDRKGQYSIRINNQWRICFHWISNQACDVEIVDYH